LICPSGDIGPDRTAPVLNVKSMCNINCKRFGLFVIEKMKNEPGTRRGRLEKLTSGTENPIKEAKCERRRESSRTVKELYIVESSVGTENIEPEVNATEKKTDNEVEYKKTKTVSLNDEITLLDTEGGVEIGSLAEKDQSSASYDKPAKSKGRRVTNIIKAEIPDSQVNECSPQ
jgi:hypothetical protein